MTTTTFNVTNTFVPDRENGGDFYAKGEFVFTFGPVEIKIEYIVDKNGIFLISDVKYRYEELVKKLDDLLKNRVDFTLGTLNGELSFRNGETGDVRICMYSGHSYHGFSTSVSHNAEDFVSKFKNCLVDIVNKTKEQL